MQALKDLEVSKWVFVPSDADWLREGILGRVLIYLASLGSINIIRN